MTWVWLDRFFDPAGIWRGMWEDLVKRPYITVGMLGFLIMVPLAITSTNGWVRRLTWKRWQRLHRIVYLAPAAGVVHYLWLVKSDIRLPVMYGVLLGILMVCRIFVWIRTRSRQRRAAAQAREPREAVTRAAE
jgi:sulfoxide reductase heme-binding subunit YedZ